MSFGTYNLSLIDDIIKTVWYTSDIKNLYHNPIILQEEDVGHIDNFILHLEQKLLDLCLQILPKDFIIIEKTKKAVFYDDSGSEYESENDSENELPITPPLFLETLPEQTRLVIFKVKKTIKKCTKLSIMRESFKSIEMKKEEEKPEKVLEIKNEWKSPVHFCDISFDKEVNNQIFEDLPKPKPKKSKAKSTFNFEGNFKRKTKKQPTSSTNVLSTIFNFELNKIKPQKKLTKNFINVKSNKNSEKKVIKCTKLCNYREKGCSRHKKGCCTFAHTFDEWNPVVCNFNGKCKKFPKCTFFHPQIETKLEYYNRTK